MSNNPNATETQYKNKKQEIESACRNVVTRLYATSSISGQVPMSNRQFPRSDEGGGGPVIDEVD